MMIKSSKLLKNTYIVFVTVLLISMITFYTSTNTKSYKRNSNEIGLNDITLGYKILIDEAHMPIYGISNESVAYELDDGFALFADLLVSEGYTIDTLNENDTIEQSILQDYDLLIIVGPTGFYSTQEISTIYNWTSDGNSLLLISDWGSFFGNSSNTIANTFGYTMALDAISDTDENEGNAFWIVFNESNIKSHEITTGISGIEVYAADGIISDPLGAMDLIATDIDDTNEWFGGGFANNVPIASARTNWNDKNSKFVLVTDTNLWSNQDTDGDGILNINELNNSQLALNIVNWLSPIVITTTAPLQGLYISFIAVFVLLVSFIRIKRRKH